MFELHDCNCLIQLVALLSTLLHRSQMLLFMFTYRTLSPPPTCVKRNYTIVNYPTIIIKPDRGSTRTVIKEKLFVFTDNYRKKLYLYSVIITIITCCSRLFLYTQYSTLYENIFSSQIVVYKSIARADIVFLVSCHYFDSMT